MTGKVLTGRWAACASAALSLAAGPAGAQAQASGRVLVLNHVTVVDTHTGRLSRDRAVVIEGGRISAITLAGAAPLGPEARTIDARGQFLVPGFLDMHNHALTNIDPPSDMAMMLANGVTGFRQMSGSDDLLKQRRAGTLARADFAPDVLAMPGALLTHGNAATVAAARAEVGQQKALGADFIKAIDMTPAVYLAALDEAKHQGIPFSGHLSPGVDAAKASTAGMRSIEHLGPTETLLISCSTAEAAVRADIASDPPPAQQGLDPASSAATIRLATANPILSHALTDARYLPRIRTVVDSFNQARCLGLAKGLIANSTWQVPTLIRERKMNFGDAAGYRTDPNWRYAPPSSRALWNATADTFAAKMTPESRETLKRLWALQLRVTRLFDRAGVPMLAGSDIAGGFGLHDEFHQLAEAGLSPLTILQMTTLNGARYLGRETTMGSVEVGKNADLVLLGADPTKSARNLHRIDAVIRAGTYYSRQDLDAAMARVAQRMASAAVAALPPPDDL